MQRCPVLLCMSFHSTLGRFFWNFITGPSISLLSVFSSTTQFRSLQISRQPSQPEGSKYSKLNGWICPNSLVALFTIGAEDAYRRECGADLFICRPALHVWEIELAPMAIVLGSPLSLIYGDMYRLCCKSQVIRHRKTSS